MGRPSKRQRQTQSARNVKCGKVNLSLAQYENQSDSSETNDETYYLSGSDFESESSEACLNNCLKWNTAAELCKFRAVYTGSSRTTAWRNRQKLENLKNSAKGTPKITSLFSSAAPQPSQGKKFISCKMCRMSLIVLQT